MAEVENLRNCSVKGKLERLKLLPSAITYCNPVRNFIFQIKGNWSNLYFKTRIQLRLSWLVAVAVFGKPCRTFPNRNFVGVDVKGDRLWKILGFERKLTNVGFFTSDILGLANVLLPK